MTNKTTSPIASILTALAGLDHERAEEFLRSAIMERVGLASPDADHEAWSETVSLTVEAVSLLRRLDALTAHMTRGRIVAPIVCAANPRKTQETATDFDPVVRAVVVEREKDNEGCTSTSVDVTFRLTLMQDEGDPRVTITNQSIDAMCASEDDIELREQLDGHVARFIQQPDGSLMLAGSGLDHLDWSGCHGPEGRTEFAHQTLAAVNLALASSTVPTTTGVYDLASRRARARRDRN